VKLARKIGGNPALAQFELEIMPGAAVEDDKLADVIASNLASHGHPTATAPMGGPPGLVGGRRLAWRPEGDRRTSCR
jgi:choline dehydrogenase